MFHPTRLWPLALTLTLAACDKGLEEVLVLRAGAITEADG